jgi:hypothetical protein
MKISKESAEQQLALLLDYYCIDMEELDSFDGDDIDVQKAVRQCCNKLTKFICNGLIEITDGDNGLQITQHLRKGGEPINYGIVNGKCKMQMKHASEKDYHGKIYHLLGAMSKKGFHVISSLEGPDLSAAETLGTIFLAQ